MHSNDLVRGTLKTLVLHLLQDHTRCYGYQLSREVKNRTEGKIILTEGALYPILHKLRQDELVTVEEEHVGMRLRKYYRLTEKGKALSRRKTFELLDFMKTLAMFIKSEPNLK